MSVQDMNGMLNRMREERQFVHDTLANVWMTLQRPLTPEGQTEALSILGEAMARIRALDESMVMVNLTAKQIDGDILHLLDGLRKVRMGS